MGNHNQNMPARMGRRHFMGQAGLLGSAMLLSPLGASAQEVSRCTGEDAATTQDLSVGMCLNESVEFLDEATARPSRQLTSRRKINYQPTYHIRQCFSADSRHLPIGSYDDQGSCVFWANVVTGDMTVLSVMRGASDERYTGNLTATIAGGRMVAAATRKTLRILDTSLLEKERVLLDETDSNRLFGAPAGSLDGKTVFIPVNEEVQQVGRPADPGHRVTANMANSALLAVDVASGRPTEVFSDPLFANNSVTPNPVYPDLLLLDRDDPGVFVRLMKEAQFARYDEAQKIWESSPLSSRTCVLDLKSGKLTEIHPRNAFGFAVHSTWSADGQFIYHHGWAAEGGHWIGVTTAAGEVVFERVYPKFFYGHIASHQTMNVIVVDGLISPDLVIGLHFEDLDATGSPRLEILARHNSDWSVPQASHPHCHVSPDGRWLSYNRGKDGHTDVCVTRIA
ncbi:MAG: hypothetical protein SH820_01000 [Xanthomonadales bacterium]|nr:hypothetical protein [Xanthomonadales bacterium]